MANAAKATSDDRMCNLRISLPLSRMCYAWGRPWRTAYSIPHRVMPMSASVRSSSRWSSRMTQRMSHSSARLHASRVPHVPRALSHSANLLMVPRMQALMTRLSRRACRSACKNKDRGKELFLSSVVAPPRTGFRNRAESSMAQNEDVLGRETEACKLFIVELSEPRPYALLEPEQACAPGSIWLSALWPGARPCLGANWMVIDSLLISLQGGPRPHAGSRISRTQPLDLIRLDDLDRSWGQDLNRRRLDVVCPWRPFARTSAHCFSFGATAWRVAEPMAKSPREMGVVAKAASVRDLAERLVCLQRRAAMHKARGVIQTKRVNEFAAGRATRRKQLLQVTQRDSRFGCDFARAEIRIGKTVLDDVADTRKQSLRMARDWKRIGRRKQRADEIVDRKLHVGIRRKDCRSVAFVGIPNEVEEQMRGRRFAARVQAAFRLASEMGQKQLAR